MIRDPLLRLANYLRKEPLFAVYNSLLSSQWLSREELHELQKERLKRLLDFVCTNVPFYKSFAAENEDTWEIFTTLPKLTRDDLRNNTINLTPLVKDPHYTVSKTSGSTGRSLTIHVSNTSWAFHHANILRILSWFGIAPFEKQGRIAGRLVDFESKVKVAIKDWLFNRIRLPVFSLSKNTCRAFYFRMLKSKVRYLYGYATGLAEYTRFLRKENLAGKRLGLKAIVSTAEVLRDEVRDLIMDYFGCPVVNIYGSAEVGIIAGECPHGKLHTPVESIVVESAPSGVEWAEKKILVTDLHNYAMPVIRYELGDLVSPGRQNCKCGRNLPVLLDRIWGRTASMFEFEGKMVHSLLFQYIVEDVFLDRPDRLQQYLVVREAEREFTLYLKIFPEANSEEIEKARALFSMHLAPDVRLEIHQTNDIPSNLNSGKRDTFFDKYAERS